MDPVGRSHCGIADFSIDRQPVGDPDAPAVRGQPNRSIEAAEFVAGDDVAAFADDQQFPTNHCQETIAVKGQALDVALDATEVDSGRQGAIAQAIGPQGLLQPSRHQQVPIEVLLVKPRYGGNEFAVGVDGSLTGGEVFCKIDVGGPDGIRVDQAGRVWSSAGDGVQIFSPAGKLLGKILVPESPANLCFGGADGKTLFMTARKSLYAIKVSVTGAAR